MSAEKTQYTDVRFTEFDSFVETAHSFNWQPVQLSKGPLNLTFRSVNVGDFGVFHLSFEPRVHDKSVVQPGTVAFSLVMSECHFGGTSVQQPSLGVMLDTREYRSTFEPGFECHEFYCSRDLLETHPLGDLVLDPCRTPGELVFALSTSAAYRLKSIFSDLMEAHRVFLTPFARVATCHAVLNQIQRTISPCSSALKPQMSSYRQNDLFHAALALIENHEVPPHIADITGQLGVTRRALEKAFSASLGTTPGQFLLARKLTGVRNKLARGCGSVGEVASNEGFEHLSRFASQYRRLFGELPSDTLLRARGRN